MKIGTQQSEEAIDNQVLEWSQSNRYLGAVIAKDLQMELIITAGYHRQTENISVYKIIYLKKQ